MARLTGNIPIMVVQGSTYKIRRKFSQNVDEITSVVITCNLLNVQEELERIGNEFVAVLPHDMTSEFEVTETTYDMTVTYEDGTVDIQTGIPFIVIERQNPIEQPEEEA